MPSPTTTRGLLGNFPRGVDPPATDQRATTTPVRLSHVCPYGRYQRPGKGLGPGMGEEAQGALQAAARYQGRKGGEAPEKEGGTGTQQGGRADGQRQGIGQRPHGGGRQQRKRAGDGAKNR